MKSLSTDSVVALCCLLPDDFFRKFLPSPVREGRALLLGDKVALAENAPDFYWRVALYYFEAQRPMPAILCRHVAFRAYVYLKNRGRIPDEDLALAYARRQRPTQRDLLRGFLLTNATLEQIASWLHLKVEAVRLFSELFWNVRHRLQDGLFIADLLCLEKFGDQEDGLALMQIAYTEGALAFVREARLVHVARNSQSTPELYDRLERRILLAGNAGTDRGLYGPKLNAAGHQALELLLAKRSRAQHETDEDMRRGLGGMSLSRSVNEAAKKIFQPDVDHRVALQLGQVMDQAREAAKKAAQNSQEKTSEKPN